MLVVNCDTNAHFKVDSLWPFFCFAYKYTYPEQ